MDQNKYQISILLNHVCVYTTVVGTRILFLQMSTPKLSIKPCQKKKKLSIKRRGYILIPAQHSKMPSKVVGSVHMTLVSDGKYP